MASVELSYYYGYEAEQFSFYRIPKLLFTDSRFAGISTDAKLLYGILLDRMSLGTTAASGTQTVGRKTKTLRTSPTAAWGSHWRSWKP